MTLQFGVALRNARLAAIESAVGTGPKLQLFSGAQPANCAAADTGVQLAEITLPSDWLGAPSGGAAAFAGLPVSVTAGATGVIAHFRIKDSGETVCHAQGSVTLSGDGGDLFADNLSVNSGQNVQITGYTFTEGNA